MNMNQWEYNTIPLLLVPPELEDIRVHNPDRQNHVYVDFKDSDILIFQVSKIKI